MKIVWFGSITDCDADMTRSIARCPDIELTYFCVMDKDDCHNDYHQNMLTKADNIEIVEVDGTQISHCFRAVAGSTVDLVVIRHPVWVPSEDHSINLAQLLENSPYLVWTWEWVPNYAMAQMPPLTGWKRIAVTNSEDLKRAKLSYPDKQILYFPFGVVPWTDDELKEDPKYKADIVCDAQPHYECGEYNAIKRYSVDKMIMPVTELNYDVALWGSRYGDTTIHDWGVIEQLKKYHRGHFLTPDYPTVYSSAKIYLGVTWNYLSGGFSIRLARALGCGIMTIWQETSGGKIDIPDPNVLEWSNDFQKTKELIKKYLTNDDARITMARRAREWSLENWEWSKTLRRLAQEIR